MKLSDQDCLLIREAVMEVTTDLVAERIVGRIATKFVGDPRQDMIVRQARAGAVDGIRSALVSQVYVSTIAAIHEAQP